MGFSGRLLEYVSSLIKLVSGFSFFINGSFFVDLKESRKLTLWVVYDDWSLISVSGDNKNKAFDRHNGLQRIIIVVVFEEKKETKLR